jgi:hypothetical protein
MSKDPVKDYYKKINNNDKLNIETQNQYDIANIKAQNQLLKDIKDINKKHINRPKTINPEDEKTLIKQSEYDKYVNLNDKYASTARDELLNKIKDATNYPLTLNDDVINDYKILKKNMTNIMTNLGSIESIVNSLTIEQIKKLNNNFINTQNKYINKYGFNNPNLTNEEIKIFLLNEISMSKPLEIIDIEKFKNDIINNLTLVGDNVDNSLNTLIEFTEEINALKDNGNISLKNYKLLINKFKKFKLNNEELKLKKKELEEKIENLEDIEIGNDIEKKILIESFKIEHEKIENENLQLIRDYNEINDEMNRLLLTLQEKDETINELLSELNKTFNENEKLNITNNKLLIEVNKIKNLNDEIKKDYEEKLNYNKEELNNIKKLIDKIEIIPEDKQEDEIKKISDLNEKLNNENKLLNEDLKKILDENISLTMYKTDNEKIRKIEIYKTEIIQVFCSDNGFKGSNPNKEILIKYILDNSLFDKFINFINSKNIEPKRGKKDKIPEKKGQGINNLIKLGDIYINKKKLYNDNIISICYANKCKIDLYNNKKISDLLVDLLMNIIDNKNINKNDYILLPDNEKLIYNSLLRLANLHKQNNVNIEDTVEKLKHQFQLLEGEISAGNTNKNLIIELKEVLRKMINFKLISLANAKKYIKEIISLNK